MAARRKTSTRTPPEPGDDLRFQRWNWRVQRAGWMVLGLVLALAVAGLFGQGRLTERTAGRSGELQVRYHRVLRLEAEAPITLAVPVGPAGRATLAVDQEFLGHTDVEQISPEPERVESGPDGQRMIFAAAGTAPVPVRLVFVPKKLGTLRVRLSAGSAASLPVTFFVLP